MNFFSNCKSSEDAKEIFRKLSKCFHPDKGGNVDLMAELNKQYENWEGQSTQSYFSYGQTMRVVIDPMADVNYYRMRYETSERTLQQTRINMQKLVSKVNDLQYENRVLVGENQSLQESLTRVLEKKKIMKEPRKRKLRKIINAE